MDKESFGPGFKGFEVIFMGDREEVEDTFKIRKEGGNVFLCIDFEGSANKKSGL